MKTMLRLFTKSGTRTGWLFPCALIAAGLMTASPAVADRPGTPSDVHLVACPNAPGSKAILCGRFINRADEEVRFEYEFAVKDAQRLTPRIYCDRNQDRDICYWGADRKYKGLRHRTFVFTLTDLEYNTEYCIRFRARRVSDSMVSGTYSNVGCARTPQQPGKPPTPNISVRFLGTQYGPNGTLPEKLEIAFPDSSSANYQLRITDGAGAANVLPLFERLMSGSEAAAGRGKVYYPVDQRTPSIRVEICAANISGRTCNTKIVSIDSPSQVGDTRALCKQGEVWRERHNGDVVCVHPDQRWVMEDGSCRYGYVKLGVGPKKDTCGTPKMKAKAEADAAKAEAAAAKDKLQSGNPQDFAGTWSTTKKGETIILTLQVNGNDVTGDFASTSNPENKGTLTGTVKTYDGNFGPIVKLSYTSTQPVEANGSFDVFTDGKLEGGYTWREPGKAKKTFVRWNGTRASN